MGVFFDGLKKQSQQLTELLALLDRELHLISVREPDELVRLVEDKNTLLDAIQSTDATIAEIYTSLPCEDDGSVVLNEQEQSLLDSNITLLEQCKYNTSINQKAVEQGQLKLTHLRQLIMDVRAKESLTYDKTGNTRGGKFGKGISA